MLCLLSLVHCISDFRNRTFLYVMASHTGPTRFLGAAKGRRGSGFGTSEFHPCFLWLWWPPLAKTYCVRWGGLQASAKRPGRRSAPPCLVLNQKLLARLLHAGQPFLPQVEEFKHLGILFISQGRVECEIDRLIAASAAKIEVLHQSVWVKRVMSHQVKLLIYRSVYVLTLTYGLEFWIITKRMRSQIQSTEISF